MPSLIFRISAGNGDWQSVYDQSPGIMSDSEGQTIVGNWQVSHYE